MNHQIVAMACIPGSIVRGAECRMGLEYAKYGQLTWSWWCKRHNITFVILDDVGSDITLAGTPPTVRRWLALSDLLQTHGPDSRIAFVDADTMIRWDAPNFLAYGGSNLAAVRATTARWIHQSIEAYKPLFPGVSMQPSRYFDAGVVILGQQQRSIVNSLANLYRVHWPVLQEIQAAGNVGSDQTPLNCIVWQEREPIVFLPQEFNMLHCDLLAELLLHRCVMPVTRDSLASKAQQGFLDANGGLTADVSGVVFAERSEVLDFVTLGYVWHFTALYHRRASLMRETWHRIRHNYPGVECVD